MYYVILSPNIRLDYQPLFEKGARAPPRTQTRHERAAEIKPIQILERINTNRCEEFISYYVNLGLVVFSSLLGRGAWTAWATDPYTAKTDRGSLEWNHWITAVLAQKSKRISEDLKGCTKTVWRHGVSQETIHDLITKETEDRRFVADFFYLKVENDVCFFPQDSCKVRKKGKVKNFQQTPVCETQCSK